jgi:two-component system cell cycle sensor histidine kinase PleC
VAESAAVKRLDSREVAVPEDVWLQVDRVHAVQIFVNLLRNAVAFTPSGGAIGIRVDAGDPDAIDVAVWDTGPGIPEDKREHVFAPFTHATDDVYTRTAEGAGLGLSHARGLATLMGGWISVHPRPGGGSEFVVRLPQSCAARQADQADRHARNVA